MAKLVEFRVSRDGDKVTVDAKGFKGKQCLDFSQDVMDKLGVQQDFKKKPEYHQSSAGGTSIRS